jgi:HD superfamily phosphohydrolase
MLETRSITTWDEARRKFLSVIDPFRAVSTNNRLFVSSDRNPQAIPLPVSRLVPVGDAPLKVINTRIFQRLRGVKQLSFCEWRFPGATHSRFEHSLGVFSLVKRAIDSLIHNETFRAAFDAEDIKGLLLASLVHDIGHYPFAHVLEQYTASRFPDSQEAKETVSHYHHTLTLLKEDKELNGLILEHWGETALQRCLRTLTKQAGVLSDIIDSAIDCDKIDYLTRDALHCGVAFGKGLDIEGLLRSYCPVQNAQRLGVNELGVASVEGLMVLQHQMLSTVYWHQTVRGIICMFHAVFAHLIGEDLDKLKHFTAALKACKSDNHAFVSVIEPRIRAQDSNIRTQLLRLVDFQSEPDYKKLYSSVCTYSPGDEPPKTSHVNIHSIIVRASSRVDSGSSLPIEWKAVKELRQAFVASFGEKNIKMDATQLVVDVPYGKSPHRPIYVRDSVTGREEKITAVSHLKETVFEQPAAFVSPVRVYIAPELKAAAGAQLQSIILSAEEKFFLRKEQDSAAKNRTPV